MTLDLKAILERAEKATPGPWTLGKRTGGYIAPGDYDRLVYPGEHGAPVCSLERPGARHRDDADAEFIAHARVDVPALVREVEGLRDALAKFGTHHNWCDSLRPSWPKAAPPCSCGFAAFDNPSRVSSP